MHSSTAGRSANLATIGFPIMSRMNLPISVRLGFRKSEVLPYDIKSKSFRILALSFSVDKGILNPLEIVFRTKVKEVEVLLM